MKDIKPVYVFSAIPFVAVLYTMFVGENIYVLSACLILTLATSFFVVKTKEKKIVPGFFIIISLILCFMAINHFYLHKQNDIYKFTHEGHEFIVSNNVYGDMQIRTKSAVLNINKISGSIKNHSIKNDVLYLEFYSGFIREIKLSI